MDEHPGVGRAVPDWFGLVHYKMQYAPRLSHFTGEHAMTPYMMFGARGVYSWFVNFNARYMVEMKELFTGPGNLHGIVGKALTAASSFLVSHNRTRRPYLPIPEETVHFFRQRLEEEFPDLLWRG